MIMERLQSRYDDWCHQSLERQQHCLTSPMQPEINLQDNSFRVFCSNNYLGLANHERMRKAIHDATELAGVGSGASHMVVGHHQYHRDAQQAFADHFGFESALLFSTGYMANVGVIQALVGAKDFVYQDRLSHASLIDGVRLSGATSRRYRHGDGTHLQELLEKDVSANQLVITDAVFSMEGDTAPLPLIAKLRQEKNFALMVDDAHGIGVVGHAGLGSLSAAGLSADDVDVYICPLGKAFGAFGAMVMGKKCVIDALRQFSRSYMYTTAMPAALAAAALESLRIVQSETWRVEKLQELIAFFKMKQAMLDCQFLPSDTAIQSLLVGDTDRALKLSQHLYQKGFLVSAIRYPTVPKEQARLRFTLNVGQTVKDMDDLFVAIESGLLL